MLRGVGRPGEVCGPHACSQRLSEGQRTQQSHSVFRRNRPVPQDRPVRQKGMMTDQSVF